MVGNLNINKYVKEIAKDSFKTIIENAKGINNSAKRYLTAEDTTQENNIEENASVEENQEEPSSETTTDLDINEDISQEK